MGGTGVGAGGHGGYVGGFEEKEACRASSASGRGDVHDDRDGGGFDGGDDGAGGGEQAAGGAEGDEDGGVVLVGSGLLRLPLRRFISVNLLATIPKSAVLFGTGYFFGNHYPFLARHAVVDLAVLCVIGAASIALALRRPEGIGVRR
jgi:hypothetical protein